MFRSWILFTVVTVSVSYDAVRGALTRLVPGPDRGRVEVKYGGMWGTVCDDSFGYADARVVCRSLGLTSAHAKVTEPVVFGQGIGKIWLDDVTCQGYESNLYQCHHRGWGVHNCGHRDDVGVICHPDADAARGALTRLVPGPDRGRVEVNYAGMWGTVCDDSFGNADARVVCRSLGLTSAHAEVVDSAVFGQGIGRRGLDDVTCQGHEINLYQCRHRGWSFHNCGHHKDVGVICHPDADAVRGVATRLVPGPEQGRLEVYVDNAWGTVCDDGFNQNDASVVCRSLGFSNHDATIVTSSVFGEGVGNISMDDVACSGHESNLIYCRHPGWGVHNCSHSEDVGVICSTVITQSAISTSQKVLIIGGGLLCILMCVGLFVAIVLRRKWRSRAAGTAQNEDTVTFLNFKEKYFPGISGVTFY